MHGLSLVPVLQGGGKAPAAWRDCLYYHFYDHTPEHSVMRHDGVFDARYKLIHFYDETGAVPSYEEFYDLQTDPTEVHNVLDNPAYADKIAELRARLDKAREELAVEEF